MPARAINTGTELGRNKMEDGNKKLEIFSASFLIFVSQMESGLKKLVLNNSEKM